MNTSCQYCEPRQSLTYKKQYFKWCVDAHIDSQVGFRRGEKAEVTLHLSGRTRPEVQPKVSQWQKRSGVGSGLLAAKAQSETEVALHSGETFLCQIQSSSDYFSLCFFPPISIFLSTFNWVQCIHQIQLFAGKLLEHKANAPTVINPANSPTIPDRQEEEGKPGTFSFAFTSGYFTHH